MMISSDVPRSRGMESTMPPPSASIKQSIGDIAEPPPPVSMVANPQQFIEQSIAKNPVVCLGLAVAAGVLVGCLVKRR